MMFFLKYYFSQFFNLGKKIFLVLTTFTAVISLFIYFINKDKPKQTVNLIEKNRQEIYQTINNPELKKTKEGKIFIALYRAMYCGFIGEACTDNPKDGDKNFNHSIFGFLTKLIVLPYANPPASGVYWAYSGLQNAGFVPKTYAAEGIGMAAIRPFVNLWKVFRDISYMLLVLVLITIGFMIMFRAKLNPQTVISVENSLPKIVVSLILITFSFPIAGFLIDLMYVIIIVIIGILAPQLSFTNQNINEIVGRYLNPKFGDILPQTYVTKSFATGAALYNLIPEQLRIWLSPILQILFGVFNIYILKNVIGAGENGPATSVSDFLSNVGLAGFTFGKLPKIIGFFLDIFLFLFFAVFGVPFILGILVVFTILFILFRVFFNLFMNYLQIILLIIFSPFILLLEAVPGKNTFSFWLKNLIANLFGFIVVLTLILINNIMNHLLVPEKPIFGLSFLPSPAIIPSPQQPWTPPFLYGIDNSSLSVLISMGIFLLIPDFLKLIKEIMGAKGLPLNLSLGTFFGGVGALWGGGIQGISQITSLQQTPGIGKIIRPIAQKLKLNMPTPLSQEYFQELIEKGVLGNKK